jgi:hypothetical protein
MAEQWAFNPLVQGSTPWRPTWENVSLIMVVVDRRGTPVGALNTGSYGSSQILASSVTSMSNPLLREAVHLPERTGLQIRPVAHAWVRRIATERLTVLAEQDL